jgi:hypothetical protein
MTVLCQMCGEREVIKEVEGYPGLCEPCVKEWNEDAIKFREHRKQGHNRHCASRLVWGDGECECGLREEATDDKILKPISALPSFPRPRLPSV